MPRVGLVTTFPSPDQPIGGVGDYAKCLTEALSGEGIEVRIFAQRTPVPFVPAVPAWDVGWRFLGSINRTLLANPVEVVHIQHEPFLFGDGVAAMLAIELPRIVQARGIVCVMTLHAIPWGTFVQPRSGVAPVVGWMSRRYLQVLGRLQTHVGRFIVHEVEQAEALEMYAGIPSERVTVIPHGISFLERAEANWGDRPFTVGSFGYLSPYKDFEYLLSEFCILRSLLPEARLLFSLSPHPRRRGFRQRHRFERLIRRARGIEGVSVLGHLPDQELPSFLWACDMIAAPYRYLVAASGVVAAALGAGVPALVPSGSGAIAQLEGWSFPFTRGGLSRALFEGSLNLPEMRMQAKQVAAHRTWLQTSRQHGEVYESL
jgi:glycosyltransferase involved in cell wall biosynthesis